MYAGLVQAEPGFLLSRFLFIYITAGELAQLARASALQAEGQGFEPPILHHPENF